MDACAIVGHGIARATLDEIVRLRREPGPGRPDTMTYQLLKHADEHTVVALAAMLDALAKLPMQTDFSGWGIVAAPRWPGRIGLATAIERYRSDGAPGVSPLAIPNLCLHSLSATVSIVFGMHGPNYGVGGGLASVADGLSAGLCMQLEQQPPGTWVFLTEWDREPGRVENGEPSQALAVALALAPVERARGRRVLSVYPGRGSGISTGAALTELASSLEGAAKPWCCALDGGLELALTDSARLKAAG